MSPRIEKIKDAVQVVNRCKAEYLESVLVREMFRNQIAWEGVVEVFAITGHPRASKCYAWAVQGDKEDHYTTVLEIPPVDSPNAAVRASIAARVT